MSVETLQTLSLIAYILAAVFFLLAVFLFFYLKVPALWGEVSGRTARKAIRAMKWKGEEASSQPAKRTDAAAASEKAPLIAAEQKPPLKTQAEAVQKEAVQEEAVQKEAELGQTDILPLAEEGQTAILPQPSAVVTPSDVGETAVLSAAAYSEFVIRSTGELPRMDETTMLTQAQEKPQSAAPSVFFVMEQELAFTDSTEIIE